MVEAARIRAAWGLILFAGAAGLSFATVVLTRPTLPGSGELAHQLNRILLYQSLLPRGATALLCGGMLGLSGALLQRVLRNPIADPSTLGIAAGAQLALTLATVFAPFLIGYSREGVAFSGGLLVVGLILALSLRRGLDPVTVVLSGLVVSMIAASVSATLVLARGEYVLSLYIWGAGALNQQNWESVWILAPRLLIGCAGTVLLLRPLSLLALDDASARSLGLALVATRVLIIALAVWLAATVVAQVGAIGFVGLAAPTLARILGARTSLENVVLSIITGALILSATDSAVQILGNGFSDLAPTGAATALLGGPLLLWLLPRLRFCPVPPPVSSFGRRAARPIRAILIIASGTFCLALATVMIGQTDQGWQIASGPLMEALLTFRIPRMVVAGGAGAMLAAAGALMQRLTGNPLASPEVLGVSVGAGVGLAITLFIAPPHPVAIATGLSAGALTTLTFMLVLSARSGFNPERLLLSGIAVGALGMAAISTVLAQGDMRSYALLTWLSGSTNSAGNMEAWGSIIACAVLLPPLFATSRWLDILPLGEATTRGLGVEILPARLTLALFAALLTAAASFLVGPLSLIGLVGPHMARLLGFARGRDQLAASLTIGAGVMILADWLSRVVAFPYQVPVGLFAALIGGPYLIWLMSRGDFKNA